jgi:Cu-Zn family superoxide dismutase
MQKQTVVLLAGAGLALSLASGGVAGAQGAAATAALRDGAGQLVGTVAFSQTAQGVLATGQLRGLPPGLHGFHVHGVGRCEPPFASAGDHWNPTNRQHGVNHPNGPHLGDAYSQSEPAVGSNVRAGPAGAAPVRSLFRGATIAPGPLSIFDADGNSVMVHAMADDNVSDPGGEAGGRLACGVIVAGVPGLPRTGGGTPVTAVTALGVGLAGLIMRRRR